MDRMIFLLRMCVQISSFLGILGLWKLLLLSFIGLFVLSYDRFV